MLPAALCRQRWKVPSASFLEEVASHSWLDSQGRVCQLCASAPNAKSSGITWIGWKWWESHGQSSLVGYSPWGRKELYVTEATEHTHQYAQKKIYSGSKNDSQEMTVLWMTFFTLYFSQFYKKSKPQTHVCCCCIINIQVPPNSKKMLPHQRVALLGLIREPPGLDPPVQTLPGSAPLQAEGRTAVGGWVGGSAVGRLWALGRDELSPGLNRVEKRSKITVKIHRLLHAGDTMSVTHPMCSLTLHSEGGTMADYWSSTSISLMSSSHN